MSAVEWSEQLSVHDEQMDAEHRRLLGSLEELENALVDGSSQKAVSSIAMDLIAFTSAHFSSEEKKLADVGYRDFDAHKKIHGALAKQVAELLRQHAEGRLKLTPDTVAKISRMVKKHILEVDMKYSTALRQDLKV